MRVVMSLVVFVFTLISVFAGVAKMIDVQAHTTYHKYETTMVVKEKSAPKGFAVVLVDENGREYKYEQNWCENHEIYAVGTKHNIKIEAELYKKTKNGYVKAELTEKFNLNCNE